jgi:hypothetical protein
MTFFSGSGRVTMIAKESSMTGVWIAIALTTFSLLVVAPLLTGRRTPMRDRAPVMDPPIYDWIRGP